MRNIIEHSVEVFQEAKELNITRQNIMSREDLQKAIKGSIIKYKEIIFGVNL